ncbi:YbjN domain-containing protein [Corynebacterium flavescens]
MSEESTSQVPTLLPDTPVEPVTLERVAEIFDSENLQYRIEEQPVDEDETVHILRTGFSNAAIALQLRNDTLTVDSVWRGTFATTEGPKLLSVINSWNQQSFAPTLRFFEGPDNTLAASGVRELDVTHGASRNQLGAFVMSTLDAILQSFSFLEEQYPALVTWEEPNHD